MQVQAAAHSNNMYLSTYAMLSDISDTFRLLIESMDFIDQDGNGWDVLLDLCDASVSDSGEPASREALLSWMLRLVSSEMKMCGTKRHYAKMLCFILGVQGQAEASRLLLRLGGPGSIDSPVHHDGGYTILHLNAAHAEGQEGTSVVLAHGPDVHRSGWELDMTPEEESPFSLVLYSSWGFADWLDALVIAGRGFEEFVTEEMQRNSTTHPGWEKETLLNLATYHYLIDSNPRRSWQCGDCSKKSTSIGVQPHWRHFLERIKQGLDPYDSPAEASLEVDEEESAEGRSTAEAVDNPDDPTEVDDVSSEIEAESESGSELELQAESESESGFEPEYRPFEPERELWDTNPHDYPTTVSPQSNCVYCPHDIIE
ncbi:MAG: hypothetical protein LQ346_002002 [Caloplaca aetnensis]|nr:MAG: hypothetical protein LQ346_002002 [Caloplaca aetnensis]